MVYIDPDKQRRLVAVDVRTKTQNTVTTIFLAVVIIISVAVVIGAAVSAIGSLFSIE